VNNHALDRERVGVVLRRAAELDLADAHRGSYGAEAVEEAAVEAGLQRWAVRQALLENSAGLLQRRSPVHVPAFVTVRRTLTARPADASSAVEQVLKSQGFESLSAGEDRTTWRPSSQRLSSSLRSVETMTVTTVEETGGRTTLLVAARLRHEPRLALPFAINSITLFVGASVLTGMGQWHPAVALWSASAGVGGAGTALGTWQLRKAACRVGTALDDVLADAEAITAASTT